MDTQDGAYDDPAHPSFPSRPSIGAQNCVRQQGGHSAGPCRGVEGAHHTAPPGIAGRLVPTTLALRRLGAVEDAAPINSEININGTVFSRASLCYNAFMKPSEALDAHRAELRELVSRHGLLGARVFGSVLTGTDDEESDLDLLVDPTKTTTLFTLAGFKADAEELLGVPVSVLTPDALPPKFRSQVLQQARPL